MVSVTATPEKFIFKIEGWHQIWALCDKIIISREDVLNVYQDREELRKWKGFRVGTEIPGIITAGTFSWKGKRNFWDVMKKKNTLIVELQNNTYTKLYIEVENPEWALQFLKAKNQK